LQLPAEGDAGKSYLIKKEGPYKTTEGTEKFSMSSKEISIKLESLATSNFFSSQFPVFQVYRSFGLFAVSLFWGNREVAEILL